MTTLSPMLFSSLAAAAPIPSLAPVITIVLAVISSFSFQGNLNLLSCARLTRRIALHPSKSPVT
jgi:hypothetical protein